MLNISQAYEYFTNEISSYAPVAVLAAIIALSALRWVNDRKLPPGPIGLPFVGYLPFMTDKPYIKLHQLSKKYGPVFSLRLGSKLTVILADYTSMKEAFNKDVFIGRPSDFAIELNSETIEKGAFTHLPWKEQRKFSVRLLRDLGLGRTMLETNIKDEIREVLQRIEEHNEKPISATWLLAPSTSNNITSLLFGQRKDYDDPERRFLDNLLKRGNAQFENLQWLVFFPYLRAIAQFFQLGQQSELRKTFSDFKAYIRKKFEEHRKLLDPNHVRSYLDGYLLEIEKTKGTPNSSFIDAVLEDLVIFFFGAGSDTIRIALEWLLLTMATYPEMQKRVQSEIDDVIGNEKFPSKSDSLNMPYTEAVIMEVLRWRGSLPINLPRCAIEDTTLNSYRIPKNSQVFALNWAVHHDPELWGDDVGSFNPDRFLSENGKHVRKPEYYIPFSTGKRACPGESFALMQLFMYTTAIFQKYDVQLPEHSIQDLNGVFRISLQPMPFEICFINRKPS